MQCMYESHQLSDGYYLAQKHFVTRKLCQNSIFDLMKFKGESVWDYWSDKKVTFQTRTWIIYNLEIMVIHSYLESQDSSPRDR